jgi:hypothetical protein
VIKIYSTNDDYAISEDYDDWDAYKATGKYPKEKTLIRQRTKANGKINQWIGSGATDINDARYNEYCKDLEIEVIKRIQDKQINRHTSNRNIYSPHDHLYKDEKDYLMSVVGVNTGYRTAGMTSTGSARY